MSKDNTETIKEITDGILDIVEQLNSELNSIREQRKDAAADCCFKNYYGYKYCHKYKLAKENDYSLPAERYYERLKTQEEDYLFFIDKLKSILDIVKKPEFNPEPKRIDELDPEELKRMVENGDIWELVENVIAELFRQPDYLALFDDRCPNNDF